MERYITALPLSYSAMNGGNRIRTGDLSIRFEVTLPGASDMDTLFFKRLWIETIMIKRFILTSIMMKFIVIMFNTFNKRTYPRKMVKRYGTALPLSYSAMNGRSRIRTGDLSINSRSNPFKRLGYDGRCMMLCTVPLLNLSSHGLEYSNRAKVWRIAVYVQKSYS